MAESPRIPTERLVIAWPAGLDPDDPQAFNDYANAAILAKAAELVVAGEASAFEVWYVGIPGRAETTAADFDAVEVDPTTGEVTTLPPYSELEEATA